MNCQKCGEYNPSGSSFCGSCGDEICLEQAVPPKVASVRASFLSRALAFLIDTVLLLIADILFNFAFYGIPGNNPVTFFLLFTVYFWYFTASSGQTAGKMFLNIKVTALDGAKPGAGKALARTFLYWLSGLFCFAGFFLALGKEKLAFHDRLTRTNVIRL